MLNMTARLAVEIKVLPDWDVDWSDTVPQRDPATLGITDILPTNDDGIMLRNRAKQHIMLVLVDDFPHLLTSNYSYPRQSEFLPLGQMWCQ